MKPRTALLLLIAICLIPALMSGQLTSGPLSPYYVVSNGISVVQGLNPVWSFPTVYGPDEAVLAISCRSAVPCTSIFDNITIHSRTDGGLPGVYDGDYTGTGVPTGYSYFVHEGPPYVYDGTSDGIHNYYVQHIFLSPTVFVTDLHWQNEAVLFNANLDAPSGITYDTRDHTLWLSFPGGTVAEFALDGTLLHQFGTSFSGLSGGTALSYDPADGTLCMDEFWDAKPCPSNPQRNCMMLAQWSTDGMLLQNGVVDGLYAFGFTSGEMPEPTPEPSTLVLLGTGVLGIEGVLRRRLGL